ncbi:MAG: hypothetical protein ACRD1A_11980, partial [Terriglobales bacterium]
TPSSGKYATIQAGTYAGALVKHHGEYPAIMLSSEQFGSRKVPALGGSDPLTGAPFVSDAEIHHAGRGNYTGVPVSEGCSVVCTDQYSGFAAATGMTAPAPQRVFTILLETSANGGSQ